MFSFFPHNQLFKEILLWKEPMKMHTTIGIGGPADVVIVPDNENTLKNILNIASTNKIPLTVIGNGSNLLISDNGIDGAVIKITGCLDDVTIENKKITAGGGCHLSRLIRLAADAGLAGLEFAIGIPGTVAGSVVMNAGARKTEIGDLVTKVRVMDKNGELIELSQKELQFGYRQSSLQGRDFIVLSVEMELVEGVMNEIKNKIEINLKHRKNKQPINFRSAGSIFKNPPNNYAGRLIESSGCKGMKIGDAQVSEVHANFIVNLGNATAKNVLQLISRVQEIVFSKYDIKLKHEIIILGRGIKSN